jgi:hypothetical protein
MTNPPISAATGFITRFIDAPPGVTMSLKNRQGIKKYFFEELKVNGPVKVITAEPGEVLNVNSIRVCAAQWGAAHQAKITVSVVKKNEQGGIIEVHMQRIK